MLAQYFIPKKVESLNKFNNKKSRWAYKDFRDSWYKAMALFVGSAKKMYEPGIYIYFIRIYDGRSKIIDKDNAFGATKPARDYLVKAGFIKDDSPRYIDYWVTQRQAVKGEKEGLIIIFDDKLDINLI